MAECRGSFAVPTVCLSQELQIQSSVNPDVIVKFYLTAIWLVCKGIELWKLGK